MIYFYKNIFEHGFSICESFNIAKNLIKCGKNFKVDEVNKFILKIDDNYDRHLNNCCYK